jgi:hypothetical protein
LASHASGGTQLSGDDLTDPGCHAYDRAVDLKDATLMLLSESGDQPAVASLARTAHERLVNEEPVSYQLLDELIGEASGKGVLRAVRAKYGPVAFEAIFGPILNEIGQRKPVPPR